MLHFEVSRKVRKPNPNSYRRSKVRKLRLLFRENKLKRMHEKARIKSNFKNYFEVQFVKSDLIRVISVYH